MVTQVIADPLVSVATVVDLDIVHTVGSLDIVVCLDIVATQEFLDTPHTVGNPAIVDIVVHPDIVVIVDLLDTQVIQVYQVTAHIQVTLVIAAQELQASLAIAVYQVIVHIVVYLDIVHTLDIADTQVQGFQDLAGIVALKVHQVSVDILAMTVLTQEDGFMVALVHPEYLRMENLFLMTMFFKH